ncbi:addiction module protein [Endothiovibrio diazotrophicus]
MGIEEIQEQALRLPPEARASLARALLSSLDSMSEAQVAALWAEEAHRRDEELDQGRATAVPADEVLARARARRK